MLIRTERVLRRLQRQIERACPFHSAILTVRLGEPSTNAAVQLDIIVIHHTREGLAGVRSQVGGILRIDSLPSWTNGAVIERVQTYIRDHNK